MWSITLTSQNSQRSAPRTLKTTDPLRNAGAEKERGLAPGADQEAGLPREAREPGRGRDQGAGVGRAGGKIRWVLRRKEVPGIPGIRRQGVGVAAGEGELFF